MWQNAVTFSTMTSSNDTKHYNPRADNTAHRWWGMTEWGGVTLTEQIWNILQWSCNYCFIVVLLFFFIFSLMIETEMTCAVNLNSCSVRDRWVLECHVLFMLVCRWSWGRDLVSVCLLAVGMGSSKSCCSFPQISLLLKHSLFWTHDSHMYFFPVPVHFWLLMRCLSAPFCDTCVILLLTVQFFTVFTKVSVYRYICIIQDRSIILWTWTLMIELQTFENSRLWYHKFCTDTM